MGGGCYYFQAVYVEVIVIAGHFGIEGYPEFARHRDCREVDVVEAVDIIGVVGDPGLNCCPVIVVGANEAFGEAVGLE